MFRAIDKWLFPYLRRKRGTLPCGKALDVILCVCDHFEPHHAAKDANDVAGRMEYWGTHFPAITEQFRDSMGKRPAHTFFVPIEQYDPTVCDTLARICQSSHAEVEIHLHHDGDTAPELLKKLADGKKALSLHGFLSEGNNGDRHFGFIHGDWALDDSHPSGRHCGVRNELDILRQAGCYADFTMPAAPDPCQTRMINSIYWATDTPEPKSHDTGEPVQVKKDLSPFPCIMDAQATNNRLLMIQGPLGLDWQRKKWGILPRIENAELSGNNPPTLGRLHRWMDLHVHVQGRPEWVFIKLHTHGGVPRNFRMLLGNAMREFYAEVGKLVTSDNGMRMHYVTARELANMIIAAESGMDGNAGDFRDFLLSPPEIVMGRI